MIFFIAMCFNISPCLIRNPLYSNVHPTCLEQWASPQSQLKRSIYLLSCVTLHSPQQTWPQYCEFAHKLIHKLPKRYLPILTHKKARIASLD